MKKLFNVSIHLVYWLTYALLLALFIVSTITGHGSANWFTLTKSGLSMVVLPSILSFYFMNSWIFKHYILTGKNSKAIQGSLLTILCASALAFIFLALSFSPILFAVGPTLIDGITKLIFIVFISFANLIMGWVIAGFLFWRKQLSEKLELQDQNQELQLRLLDAKMDPHFLFNSINNVEILIENEPRKASDYLIKLADILRFLLENKENISIDKELKYIQNFIDLQLIRTPNKNAVQYKYEVLNPTTAIAKNLLIPIIENAFKHCSNNQIDNAISIDLKCDEKLLSFRCSNHSNPVIKKSLENSLKIGNDLLHKRLELLYPGNHQFETMKKDCIYTVDLKIQL